MAATWKNIYTGSLESEIDVDIEGIVQYLYVGADHFIKMREGSENPSGLDTNALESFSNTRKAASVDGQLQGLCSQEGLPNFPDLAITKLLSVYSIFDLLTRHCRHQKDKRTCTSDMKDSKTE